MHHQPQSSGVHGQISTSRPDGIGALTRAQIDLSALRHNLAVMRGLAGEAGMIGVVKADAYGHGAVPIARELSSLGVERFAVATVTEGVKLRAAGIEEPVLVFTAALPQNLQAYADNDLGVTIASLDVAEEVARFAGSVRPLEVHLKVDTGMGRIGVQPSALERVAGRLMGSRGVDVASVWTHLATADEPESDYVEQQLEVFSQAITHLRDDVRFTHVANSAALLNHRHLLDLDRRSFVRPGVSLYGLSPSADVDLAADAGLRPVMRLVSVVTHVKRVPSGASVSYSRRWTATGERTVATVGAGYADGYPRILTNRGHIGIGGRFCRVAGTVCMDMTMVDAGAGALPDIVPGAEAVLFGEGGPSCFEVARASGTITYEIACRVSARVPREYHGAGASA